MDDRRDIVMTQSPPPGDHGVRRQGDLVRFDLRLSADCEGEAWLRTNLGNATVRRDELIQHVEEGTPLLARDWHDLRMHRLGPRHYTLELPLGDVGSFAAKACFIPDGRDDPEWPDGANTRIKVAPADTCRANAIYSAFVRQFSPATRGRDGNERWLGTSHELEDDGYTVIPPSGTFRDLARELDHIVGRMGFRIIQLLPIFPVPTTYARMGRFGSPYASLKQCHWEVDAAESLLRAEGIEVFPTTHSSIEEIASRILVHLGMQREMY